MYTAADSQTVCEKLRNPDIHKIVLMAHSQGGIILSTWVVSLNGEFDVHARLS